MTCSRCNREIPANAPANQCLRCLLRLGLEPPLPRTFGRYELLQRIGEGGMGVVFEAKEENPSRLVALKMLRTGDLANARERERFRREAQAASGLEHPNIVTVYAVSSPDERSYFTMRLLTGGTLEKRREHFRRDPVATARLVAKIARAVHHGHERGVLHRDLKPANILLDESGEPHVADFGIAKSLDEVDQTRTLGLQGTPCFMSPEQAGFGRHEVTTRSDVYSLGAILYDLLTGRPPHDGPTAAAVLESLGASEPPRPRKLAPAIPRELDEICCTCLDPDPSRRYSAETLAVQLERYAGGLPIDSDRSRLWRRAWLWSQRHPAAAGLAATVALLLLALLVASLVVPPALERQLRGEALKQNVASAGYLAHAAMGHLVRYRTLVESLAKDPHVLARIAGPPCGRFDPELEALAPANNLVSMGLWTHTGARVARFPIPQAPLHCDRLYAWTDHFKGAASRAGSGRVEGYIGRASRSEVTGADKFTVSAPVLAPDGAWRGVAYVSLGVNSMGDRFPIDSGADPRHTAMVLARRDITRETEDQPLPRGFFILLHNGAEPGEALEVQSPALDQIPQYARNVDQTAFSGPVLTDQDFHDPVPGFEGRWLAAIAPVGQTNFAVVVLTHYTVITEQIDDFERMLALWAGLPFALGALLINLGLFVARRRWR